MNNRSKIEKKFLAKRVSFYSNENIEGNTKPAFKRVLNVLNTFNMRNLGDCHDPYVHCGTYC